MRPQVIALSLHWTAIHIVAAVTGVHALAIFLHLAVKAAGACFNHTGSDFQLRFLGDGRPRSRLCNRSQHRPPIAQGSTIQLARTRCTTGSRIPISLSARARHPLPPDHSSLPCGPHRYVMAWDRLMGTYAPYVGRDASE